MSETNSPAGSDVHGSEPDPELLQEQPDQETEMEDQEVIETSLKLFESPDFIMESSVTDTLINFLHAGGDVENAVDLLSSNYVGYAQIVNLYADWLIEIGTDPSEVKQIVEDHLQEQILASFSPSEANAMLLQGESEGQINWLPELIVHEPWRKLIYRLSTEHPDCLMLNFTIKLISDAGHQEEISSVPTAANQLEIFSKILCTAIDKTLTAIENPIISGDHGHAMEELSRIACQSEHTYLYAQSLIFKILQTCSANSALKLRRMMQEIAAYAERKGHDTSAFTVLFHHSDSRVHNQGVMDALHSMITKKALNPADINTLYNAYRREDKDAPAVDVIREPAFIDLLIDSLFSPSRRVNPEYQAQYMFLLAYAASVVESHSKKGTRMNRNRDELQPTLAAVQKIHGIISSREVNFELPSEFATLIANMRFAVASLGLLHWVKCTVSEPDFFKLHREATPLHLALIDEIVNLHTLLHKRVFEFFTELYLTERDDIEIHAVMGLRRMLIDRMVHLLSKDYALPVIRFMKERHQQEDTDISLLRYFVLEVLEIVAPPFNEEFVKEFKPLVEDKNVLGGDAESVVKRAEFLEACKNE